jgi:hypothetical protein
MSITAERKEIKESNGRPEFVYGPLLRTVP